MAMLTDRYKGQELFAIQLEGGWQVTIGDTGKKTGVHSEASSAFDEARRFIDARRVGHA